MTCRTHSSPGRISAMILSQVSIVEDPAESTVSPADLTRCQEVGRLVLLAANPRSIPLENQSLSMDSSFNIVAGLRELIDTQVDDAEALRIRQTESRLELERILVEAANGDHAGVLELMVIVVGHRFAVIKHVFRSYSPVGQELWNHLISSANQPLSRQGFGDHLKSAFDRVESSLSDEARRRARVTRAAGRMGLLQGSLRNLLTSCPLPTPLSHFRKRQP